MKYAILIYERGRRSTGFAELLAELAEAGEFVDGAPLADPINTRTVRLRDDVVTATHGPFQQVGEHLAGYVVVDCDTSERAVEIAGRLPDAALCAVEVRPIMDRAGLEM